MMERRKFIKKGCSLCMAMAGGSALLSLLDSCTPLPLYKTVSENKKVKIPLDRFTKNNFLIVRPADFNYDIAIVKNENGKFKSLIMQCTHADNQLTFNGNEFHCSLHGSVFNRTGSVKKGPAEKSLLSLVSEVQNEWLVVTLV